jgi:tetratricopeptide (TPR) repeat protein
MFLVLISSAVFAQQAPSALPGTPASRTPFTVTLKVDKQHIYEKQFDKVPNVAGRNVYLFAGDKFGIDLTVKQDEISTLTYEPKHKRADVEFKFELRKSSVRVMALAAHNRLNRTISFEVDADGIGAAEPSRVLSFPAESYSYLLWSEPIFRVILSDLRFSEPRPLVRLANVGGDTDASRVSGCFFPSWPVSVQPSMAIGPVVLSAADSAILSPLASREYMAGQDALESGNLKAAVEHLKRAIDWVSSYCTDLMPSWTDSFPLAHEVLGQAYLTQKEYKKAKAEFQIALRLEADSGAALIGLGATLNHLDDSGGAVKALSEGLRIAPSYCPGRYELARAYISQGQLQGARTEVERILSEAPNFAAAHELMGDILTEKGQPDDAIKEFEISLQLDPKSSRLRAFRIRSPRSSPGYRRTNKDSRAFQGRLVIWSILFFGCRKQVAKTNVLLVVGFSAAQGVKF